MAATKKIRLVWNSIMSCWVLDLLEEDGTPFLTGIAVVTGCNLVEQFKYLGLEGRLIAQTLNETDAVPTYENLGTNGLLYFVTP